MKIKIFKTNLGQVFDPSKDFATDKNIVLKRHPVDPNEGATLGYLDSKLEEFYNTADIKGTIDDVSVLQIKGPHTDHTNSGLNLKKLHNANQTGGLFKVDKYGRVLEVLPLTEENFDASTTMSWNDITNKPTTLGGYWINDLFPNNKNTEFKGKMTVKYQDRKTKSPVPYGHLKQTVEESGYVLQPGILVIKINKNPGKKFIPCNGQVIYRKDYPDLVTALAGKNADSATLPDTKEHDESLLVNFGVDAKTFMFVG